jgi:hypothetical protein
VLVQLGVGSWLNFGSVVTGCSIKGAYAFNLKYTTIISFNAGLK